MNQEDFHVIRAKNISTTYSLFSIICSFKEKKKKQTQYIDHYTEAFENLTLSSKCYYDQILWLFSTLFNLNSFKGKIFV